ncbi:MAG: sensor histidine kinase [Anaerolineae bacterium]|jgi:signal transduction histidine kinase|nr:sensor histidine kinase [Anaerolineae bacterium]MBT3714041.1 sensor histidine kinase [Anaerolineae bacterium]MBT4310456.1 sensor histidine kinase [Anaerolineae bacterium]MBT4458981.1 sensor histidine kinase [Anaerolineae bacterium]MBT4842356.1 sensor histidine kinase [Anaerolineae bacterium]
MFDLTNNLTLLILLIGVVFALGVIIWRIQRLGQKTKEEIQTIKKQLDASFSLSGYLLEAHNEETIIMAAMRSGYDLLKAEGCAFVPFSEWEQTLPILKHGDAHFLNEPAWQVLLSKPATRHICRNCKNKESGLGCTLLQEPADAKNVYCVSLRSGGRVIGVISYFFSIPPQIIENHRLFLVELVRITELTLDASRLHSQELDSLRHVQEPAVSKKELTTLNAKDKGLLEQLEYQAVLNERTRLAREIHDGLAQTLAFLKMETARMQIHTSKGEIVLIDQALQACHQTLSDAYLDVRQSIDNLRRAPSENLTDWLDMTAVEFKELTGLEIDTSNIKLDSSFPNNIKAQLIRIAQEALANIRKHAQPSEVSISAFEHGGEATIEIKDNGCGFAPEDVLSSSRYGLRTMRERAESINADFQIISTPGMGTTIRLHIPTNEKINS